MNKFFLGICFAFSVFQATAQNTFLKVDNDKKQGYRFVKDAFSVVDKNTQNLAVFIDDNKTMNGYLYSKELKRIGSIASDGLPNRYDEIIGHTIKGKEITLFLKSSNNKKFGSILFDFENSKTKETKFDFKLRKENFVQTYSKDERFYLITSQKRTSDIHVYTFENGKKVSKKTLSFADKNIINSGSKEATLHDLMNTSVGIGSNIKVIKIDEHTPNSIEATGDASKLYTRDGSFLLTFDKNKKITYLIEVFLPDLSASFSQVEKPQLSENDFYDKSNSFVYEDKIFQIIASNSQMKFSAKDLKSKKELKAITLNKEEDILFKNTPIIQEGGVYNKDRVREMEKTSKFLRKISADKIGLAVKPTNSGYQITMGGTKELNAGGGAMMMPGFGGAVPVASFGAMSMSFNPTFFAYNSYTSTKSTRIESLFDNNFSHVSGEIEENAFDKIKTFADEQKNKKAENVFKYKNGYLYGNYNSKENVYELTYFED